MGGPGVSMSGVISRIGRKNAGKRIYPSARAEQTVSSVFAGAVRIGAAHAELGAVRPGGAAIVTIVKLICGEGVLHPGLADLFEAIIIVSPTAHPIEVLRDNRMIGVGYGKKVHGLIAVVARSRANAKADLRPAAA